MINSGSKIFPFGSLLKKVEQQDKTTKKAFVLGVYASAVHAKWLDVNGKVKVAALAVASEPEIFWNGNQIDAQNIINNIEIPKELGALIPAAYYNNGPSGRALDELILTPMGLDRNNTWLCDLIPYSLSNKNQMCKIEELYNPLIKLYNLPKPSIPPVPKELTDIKRREEILNELIASEAEILILLGDKPIEWFLDYYINVKILRLSNFSNKYGHSRVLSVAGKQLSVFAFAHPRQIAGLGFHSSEWFSKHSRWIKNKI